MKEQSQATAHVSLFAAALVTAAVSTGCTAGEVTYDGQPLRQRPNYEYSVGFWSADVPANVADAYGVDLTWSAPGYRGLATFSFDTHGPSGQPGYGILPVANDSVTIPPGEYYVVLYVIDHSRSWQPTAYFVSRIFDHEYASSSVDTYDGTKVPTTLYELQVFPSYGGNDQCPPPVKHATHTTIPVCFNAYASGMAMSDAL